MSDVAAFWRWFEANATRLREDPDGDAVCDAITAELCLVHDGLVGEISRPPSFETAALVLSADGDTELFPIVEALYAERPDIPAWEIIAFRPPVDPEDPGVIRMDGYELAIAELRFLHSFEDGKLELDVFVPGYIEDDETFGTMCFIALDHTVGEYRMETRIGAITWFPIEKAPSDARPIGELLALMPN